MKKYLFAISSLTESKLNLRTISSGYQILYVLMFDGEIKKRPILYSHKRTFRKRVTTSFYLSLTAKTSTGTTDYTYKSPKDY